MTWALGTLDPGESGVRHATATVAGDLADGELLGARARVVDASSPANESRTRAVTRLRTGLPLRLELVATPDPVAPGETQDVELVVSNRGGFPVFDTEVELVIPDEVDSFGEEVVTGAPLCVVAISNNGLCDGRERLVWSLGELAAGTGRTLRLPPRVEAGLLDGTVLGWRALAEGLDDGVLESAQAGAATIVQDGAALDVAVVGSADPVGAGATLTYTLSFGHRATSSVAPGAQLELVLPPEVGFTSATRGGVHAAGRVTWALGLLDPGENGTRQATVAVPGGLAEAELLAARVRVVDASSPPNESRARAVTRVRTDPPVTLEVDLPVGPIEQGQVVTAVLRVTNHTGFQLFDVAVEAVVPDGVNSFSPAQTDGGTCVVGVSNNGLCDPRERIVWTIDVAAGATVELDVFFTVASGATAFADGDILSFPALVAGGEEQAGAVAIHAVPEPAALLGWIAALLVLGALAANARATPARRSAARGSPPRRVRTSGA